MQGRNGANIARSSSCEKKLSDLRRESCARESHCDGGLQMGNSNANIIECKLGEGKPYLLHPNISTSSLSLFPSCSSSTLSSSCCATGSSSTMVESLLSIKAFSATKLSLSFCVNLLPAILVASPC